MVIWKKHKKTAVIIVSLVIVLAVLLSAALLAARRNSGTAGAAAMGYTVLARTDLVNSISVSGTIESSNSQNVFSTLNYLVDEIHVTLGDEVAAEDLLAKLDTAALELDIAQQQTRMRNNSGMEAELVNAEAALKTAEIDLQVKTTTYEDNKVLFAAGYISEQELSQAETSYKLAAATHERAAASLDAIRRRSKQENEAQQITLQRLEKNLADSLIRAPLGGTVTEIFAKVGSPGSGLLFVIEDTQNLLITTHVQEYDIGRIHEGQKVTIKSDATGDALLQGEVVKIAPTSVKNVAGETIISSPAEFETRIAVLGQDTGLKIGMNTRLNIILEEKAGVYAVPHDALSVNAAGQSIVYALINENGRSSFREVVVETGLETDFYVEVRGDGLAEGMRIANDAADAGPGNSAPQGGGPMRAPGPVMIRR